MEQPVRVGLVFPRSGQQLYVTVPPHVAQSAESRLTRNHRDTTAADYAPRPFEARRTDEGGAQGHA